MAKLKILNLYAGVGGNRWLWGNDVDVTAVEHNEHVAAVYKKFFPTDKIVVGDAHAYLEKNYSKYDFIWSSPPCQTHSRMNHNLKVKRYPDLTLYEEVLFLKYWCKSFYVVENVKPFYTPLIDAYNVSRHLFWSNFHVRDFELKSFPGMGDGRDEKEYLHHKMKWLGIKLNSKDFPKLRFRQIVGNTVHPELGLHVIKCALR